MSRPTWKGIDWHIEAASVGHEPLIKLPLPNKFTLVPSTHEPRVYRIKSDEPMSDLWKDCVLFEMGFDAMSGDGIDPLNDGSTALQFRNAGRAARFRFDAVEFRTARLVGDIIMPNDARGTVTLFQVADKISSASGKRPLLVIFVDDGGDPEGSATGRPRP